MKVIRDMVLIDLKNEKREKLMVNTPLGLIDVLSYSEAEIVERWYKQDEIVPTKDTKELFENMVDRYYIMEVEDEKKLVENTFDKLEKLQKEFEDNNSTAAFVLTYNCNFNCPYCYEKNSINDEKGYLTKEMVDKIFSLYPNGISNILLFGGEPLLPSCRQIIDYIYSKASNATYSVITNGYHMDSYLDFFKKVKSAYIQVTLDGNEETHNKTRVLCDGKPTYSIILSNIEEYLKVNIPIKIRFNITETNYEICQKEQLRLFEEFEKYGNLLTYEMQPIFQMQHSKQMRLIQDMYITKLNNEGSPNKINRILRTLPTLAQFFDSNSYAPINPIISFCAADKQPKYFDPYGNIYACILSVGLPIRSIGTYYPKYVLKENSIITRKVNKIPACSSCRYRFLCGGGCPNAILEPDGDAFKPYCGTLINQINTYVPLLYKLKYGEK